jgi:DNA-binding NarL/FixJ family response regulator
MNILLADDHVLFRDGLSLVLGQLGDDIHLLVAGGFDDALDKARTCPDLEMALLDLNMPGMDGVRSIARFRELLPDTPVVVISASENVAEIGRLLDCGASGYIPKSSSARVLLSALQLVLAGGVYVPPVILSTPSDSASRDGKPGSQHPPLTDRQLDVLRLLLQGKANKVIARELKLSEGTVKIHLAAIFRALNANNRTEAAMSARALGWEKLV